MVYYTLSHEHPSTCHLPCSIRVLSASLHNGPPPPIRHAPDLCSTIGVAHGVPRSRWTRRQAMGECWHGEQDDTSRLTRMLLDEILQCTETIRGAGRCAALRIKPRRRYSAWETSWMGIASAASASAKHWARATATAIRAVNTQAPTEWRTILFAGE